MKVKYENVTHKQPVALTATLQDVMHAIEEAGVDLVFYTPEYRCMFNLTNEVDTYKVNRDGTVTFMTEDSESTFEPNTEA
jgi:hypothetical protein